MRLINPSSWPWLLVLAVPIVLYLFRRRPRTVRVSTLAFFKLLAKAHQESPWLRRLKFLLSLLLSLLMIGLPAAGLLRPVLDASGGQLRTLVVLVDRSASMAAVDGKGRSRLDEGLDRVRRRLGALSDGTAVCLIAYDRRPEVLLPASHDRRQLERALRTLTVRPIAGDSAAALQLAHRLAELDPKGLPAAIWHVTDAAAQTAMSRPEEEGSWLPGLGSLENAHDRKPSSQDPGPKTQDPACPVERINVALEHPDNVGITAFQIRRLPMQPGQLEAFVQLQASAAKSDGGGPVEVELEARLDNEVISVRKLSVGPGAAESLQIPLKAATPGTPSLLWLKLKTDKDCLDLDNQAFAIVPAVRPIRVLWIRDAAATDPYTQLAIASLMVGSDMKVMVGQPKDWPLGQPAEKLDVVLFDGWAPKDWPADVPVILLNPSASAGPVQLSRLAKGLPVDRLRLPAPDHPLLLGVASQRLSVQQTAVLQAGDGVEPLWVGPAGAILLAGQYRDQRVVAMAFDVSRSERLAFTPSYQLLIGNAVYWTTEAALAAESFAGNNRRTGELISPAGGTMTWRRPDLEGDAREKAVAIRARQFELDRVGFWQAGDGTIGSSSLSPRATKLPAAEDSEVGTAADSAGRGDQARNAGRKFAPPDLLYLLLWVVLAVLVVESWLYHRHSVY